MYKCKQKLNYVSSYNKSKNTLIILTIIQNMAELLVSDILNIFGTKRLLPYSYYRNITFQRPVKQIIYTFYSHEIFSASSIRVTKFFYTVTDMHFETSVEHLS